MLLACTVRQFAGLHSQMSRVAALGLRPEPPVRDREGTGWAPSSSSSVKFPLRDMGESSPECRLFAFVGDSSSPEGK